MGRRRIHAAFILYKTLGYPELGYEIRKYGIDEGDWKKVFLVFSHFPHISKAILFGSRVKGIHKPFSDVDIALVGEALSLTDLLHLKNEIDDLLLPYEFDFCIYKDLKNAEFKCHIDRRGVEVYDSSRWRK